MVINVFRYLKSEKSYINVKSKILEFCKELCIPIFKNVYVFKTSEVCHKIHTYIHVTRWEIKIVMI